MKSFRFSLNFRIIFSVLFFLVIDLKQTPRVCTRIDIYNTNGGHVDSIKLQFVEILLNDME